MTAKTCQEKAAYNTEAEALAAAALTKYQHGGTRLRPYLCKICGFWHLTSDY